MEELTRTRICNLYYLQKMPIKQIARTVGYTPKTVRTVLRGEDLYVAPTPRPPKAAAAYCLIDYRNCTVCGALFIGSSTDNGHRKTCSTPCAKEHRRRIGNARKRNREHAERGTVSDITNEQELAMRLAARKCPLCGIRLTDKPGLPNSKHLDHILPLGVGGTHTLGNVRITCQSCNVRRPRDGSDYIGQLTLWAMVPGMVTRPHGGTNKTTCRKGLHPWIAENIAIRPDGKRRCILCDRARQRTRNSKRATQKQCKCGALFAAPGNTFMCPDCTDAAAHRAAELHAGGGMTWREVAAAVGYGSHNGEGARYAAKRIGYAPARRVTVTV